ncbi:MAG: plastocyanin/azurin family copper-binding protein [Pseudomonadota bacterium]
MTEQTRRRFVATAVCAACCSGAAAQSDGRKRIDQITDVGASAATDMFRFEPNLIRVSPGDSVVFLNSRGEHTVHSAPALWPENVPLVGISNRPEAEVVFPEPGFYGFRCRRHGMYGMVMLVVAGNPQIDGTQFAAVDTMKAKEREREAVRALLQKYAEL